MPRLLLLVSLLLFASNARAALDVAFVLDTTGSMGGELREAKERIRQIAEAMRSARPGERVRIAAVAFRDKGDAYVTKVSPLTDDVEATYAFLASLSANGGGDSPEDVLGALDAALEELAWTTEENAERLVYLVGDAPAHLYPDRPSPEEIIARAVERRIVLHTIGCRSLPPGGIELFRRLAYGTEGVYHHIGRVEMEGSALEEAVLSSLGDHKPDTPLVPLGARRTTALSSAPPDGPRLEPVNDARGTCGVRIAVPSGLMLDGEPSFSLADDHLRVGVSLRPGQGDGATWTFDRCVPSALPLRLDPGVAR